MAARSLPPGPSTARSQDGGLVPPTSCAFPERTPLPRPLPCARASDLTSSCAAAILSFRRCCCPSFSLPPAAAGCETPVPPPGLAPAGPAGRRSPASPRLGEGPAEAREPPVLLPSAAHALPAPGGASVALPPGPPARAGAPLPTTGPPRVTGPGGPRPARRRCPAAASAPGAKA